uniref:Zinc finger MYM-type protein 1-like n=1 Tax=Nicotiana tabacum TaxID=4097 RepID=A0A1S4CZM3_TOBAC
MVWGQASGCGKVILENAPQNDTLTCPMIQKDIINVCAKEKIKAIIGDINGDYFGILVDESKDISHTEQMALVLRYVDKNGKVVEKFVGLVHLQLTLVAIAKKYFDVEDIFCHVTNLLNVIGGSFKHRDLLRHFQAEKLEQLLESGEVHIGRGLNQERGLQRPGDTRWGSHLKILDNFIVIFSSIVRVLEVIKYEGSTSNERNQANYLLSEMTTFKFVFMLHLMLKVLAMSNELKKILQKRDQDIMNVVEFLNITKKRLQDMRESGWKSLLDDVSSFCVMHDILIPKMDLQELNDHFDVVSSDLLLGMASLNPVKSFANFDKGRIMTLGNCYPNEFDEVQIRDLSYQLDTFIVLLTLILPVATATVERAFSSMKQIKNEERNSMGDQYLNDCLVCYIERDIFTN